jgi:hypothetical protein
MIFDVAISESCVVFLAGDVFVSVDTFDEVVFVTSSLSADSEDIAKDV